MNIGKLLHLWVFIFDPIDPHAWPQKVKNWNYGCQSRFVTHHCHPYWVINLLSLLPGTAEGGWKHQSCVTLTLATRLFFFQALTRVLKTIEMREIDFSCAVIAEIFLLIFLFMQKWKIMGKKLNFCNKKRKSMSLNGIFINEAY